MFRVPVPFIHGWPITYGPEQINADDGCVYVEPPILCSILSPQHEHSSDEIESEELDEKQSSCLSDSEADFELVLSDEWKSLLRFQQRQGHQGMGSTRKKQANLQSATESLQKKRSKGTKKKKKAMVKWQERLRAEIINGNEDSEAFEEFVRSMNATDTQAHHLKQLEYTMDEMFKQYCCSSKRVMWPAYSID
uniref:AlNc14C83G5358 protein n=1 Tax=Albugo laibachii Nc14 TaxID=890382 RepID=F0WFH2_9STRA|nr:AlNc14C83G5358 [Albugo laibachii Nc14]|eukprot:CCA19954.1 AlNc14C83G5358 [Albugo laibachii Nc14]